MIDNHVNATSFLEVGEQDPRDVCEVAQGVYPIHSAVVSSSLLAVAPYADRRSGHIDGMDNIHAYSQDVPVQHQRAPPPSMFDVAAYPPKRNSYFELSLAFQEPAPVSQNQRARTSIGYKGESARATVPQEANVGFYEPL